MNKKLFKHTIRFAIPATTLAFLAACASKPEGYAALPPGSDIAVQMDQTDTALTDARTAQIPLLAPEAYEKAYKNFKEARDDRASNQSNEEILGDLSMAQAYLRVAENTAKISQPALAKVIEARTGAVDAEAQRVLPKKLVKLDEDLRDMASDIEKKGSLESSREDGPDLAKKYAELRTEALEKGGRPQEQRDLKNEVADLRAESAANAQLAQQNASEKQNLEGKLGQKASQEAKLNAVRTKFSREEADVLVNRDNEIVIRLKGLQFPSNKSDIPSQSLPLLSKLESALSEFPKAKVTVEGHTDSLGSQEVNQALSQKRAEAVKGYLVESQGDAAREISSLGKGNEEPVASNKTADGRAKNRRIDVVVSMPADGSM